MEKEDMTIKYYTVLQLKILNFQQKGMYQHFGVMVKSIKSQDGGTMVNVLED
jgi:hypothetical protein